MIWLVNRNTKTGVGDRLRKTQRHAMIVNGASGCGLVVSGPDLEDLGHTREVNHDGIMRRISQTVNGESHISPQRTPKNAGKKAVRVNLCTHWQGKWHYLAVLCGDMAR